MKKYGLFIITLIAIAACSKKESSLTINGTIKDLKKGTVYLQKVEDTILVTLDSIVVHGDPNFTFHVEIEEPEVLFLHLDKVDNSFYDDRFPFFAEPGEMTIHTTLERFATAVVVEGSENHEKLIEFQSMMDRFNSQNLDLLKESIEAQQQGDQERAEVANDKMESLLRRRYLFTVNYAINNKDKEVAPYLAVTEVFDANLKYLDTIYNSLQPQIRDSRYGKSLGELIEERKALEAELSASVEDSLSE